MEPLHLFEQWFAMELRNSNLQLPAACCLSTSGLDGYPNSRFVSLKEVVNNSFVITGSLNSRKGREIENCAKASLTFWWPYTQRQVRIQGDVNIMQKDIALSYFKERNRDSRIVSATFNQGEEIEHIEHLQTLFSKKKSELKNKEIECPENWSGLCITPIRIEFMKFQENRLHQRTLYQKVNNQWKISILQP